MARDAALAPTAARLARALYLGSAELAQPQRDSIAEMESELGDFIAVHLAGARALSRKEPI